MKTRNRASGTTSQARGIQLQKTKKSPCIPAPKGRQPARKQNLHNVLSANQSPRSAWKKDHSSAEELKFQIENIRESCISLHESASPIIGVRRPLGQRRLENITDVCSKPSTGSQGSGIENKAPLRIGSSSQENKVSPLQERINMNTPKKEKEVNEGRKKHVVSKRSVVPDKENVLDTDTAQATVRKSKRQKIASKYFKDVENVLQAPRKRQQNMKQTEATIMPEPSKPNKGGGSSLQAGKKETNPQPKPQKVTGGRSLKTISPAAQLSNGTAKSGKEVNESADDKAPVATKQKAISIQSNNARPDKETTVPCRRVKRKSSQQDGSESVKKPNVEKCDGTVKMAVSTRSVRRANQPDKNLGAKKSNVEKCDETPKITAKRTTGRVPSVKVDKTNRSSSKLPGKSQAIEPCTSSASQGVPQARSKPPVWASVKSIKITPGKRKSFRTNDTYEFPTSPQKGQKDVKKKRVTKPRKQVKKKIKPTTKFKFLTTDLSWQGTASKGMPFLSSSSVSINKKPTSASSCDNSASDAGNETSVPSNMSSIRDEGSVEDDFSGFEFEGSNDDAADVFYGFEGETRSSFVIPDNNRKSNEVVPMTSVSALPTPALSKHISKFIGGSSTPRMENMEPAAKEAAAANDSIAQCFGFDDDLEEESELNISPVQQSRVRHALEVTGTSDIMTDAEVHPDNLPSRFSWGSLRPGNRTAASTSRSSSMVAQGNRTAASTSRSASMISQGNRTAASTSRSASMISHGNRTAASTNRSASMISQGNRTAASTSRSANMATRRRSTAYMTATSHHSQSKIESFTVPTAGKQNLRPRRGKVTPRDKEGNADSRVKEADVSMLFDENDVMEKEDKAVSEASHLSSVSLVSSVSGPSTSHEKHFAKAPRRSYDRSALLKSRRKFIETYGGYADTEEETENDEEEGVVKPQAKSRKKPTKVTKKKDKKKSAKPTEDKSKKAAATTSKKKKTVVYDASVEDWASRLNNHFSEVEDSLLMVV